MDTLEIFKNLSKSEISSLSKSLNSYTSLFKKNMTVMSNLVNTSEMGIVLDGTSLLVKIDFNGNRNIVSLLERGDIFGALLNSYSSDEMVVIANSDCKILFLDYSKLFSNTKYTYSQKFIQNLLTMLTKKVNFLNKRIEVLTKKTIRERLLDYFYGLQKEQASNKIIIPFSKLELAEYLAIDRASMMRELKKLKEEKIIEIKNREITIITR